MVSAPLALAAVQRRPVPDRDQRVLKRRAPRMVRVRIAGRDRPHAECLGELAKRRVAPGVTALVRPLELDEEPLWAEGAGQLRRLVRMADGEAEPGAAGEADEPLVQLLQQPLVERGRQRIRSFSGAYARVPP